MARREPITMYFSDEEKEAIKKEAAADGKSTSEYCRSIVQGARLNRSADDLDAEQRLERIMTEGAESVEEIAESIREQNGLVIHLLREIETELDGVTVDALDGEPEVESEPEPEPEEFNTRLEERKRRAGTSGDDR